MIPGLAEFLPNPWREALRPRIEHIEDGPIRRVLADAEAGCAYPPLHLVFRAFDAVDYRSVRTVILGQDPYAHEGQACGLAFDVLPGATRPRSLSAIAVALERDLSLDTPEHVSLDHWVSQGVLLLNTALTVQAAVPGSHRAIWAPFTDAVIDTLSARDDPMVFMLWGRSAQRWRDSVASHHGVVCSPHPAARGRAQRFSQSRPFSTADSQFDKLGLSRICWRLDCPVAHGASNADQVGG